MYKSLLLTASFLATQTNSQKAGLALGMDHSVIDNWGGVIVPQIVDYINSIQIPDSRHDGSYVKDVKI